MRKLNFAVFGVLSVLLSFVSGAMGQNSLLAVGKGGSGFAQRHKDRQNGRCFAFIECPFAYQMRDKTTILLGLFLFLFACIGESSAQDTEARLVSTNEFQLSPEAVSAGIDGKILIGLTINQDGNAGDLRMYGGPMWPCGSKMPDEVEKVRRALKQHVLSLKFEAATKNGKARSSQVQITFLLSDLFRKAHNYTEIEENLKKGISPPLVEIKDISKFALSVPKQLTGSQSSPSARLAEIQLLVDETVNVSSAGGFRIGPNELLEARDLACSAKFKPLTLNQKPVKMSGTIMYGLY